MTLQSRIPAPVDATSTHGLRSMRSEGCLKGQPERKVRHLRSVGQLSSPPNKPLPPLPPGFTPRPLNRFQTLNGIIASSDCECVANTRRTLASKGSSSSKSTCSQDLESEIGDSSPCNTMLIQEHTHQGKVEFQLRNDAKHTPRMGDLSHLLELSVSLKEMGVSFSANGQMRTYGNPPLDEDLKRMLDLGTEYDTSWHTFFTRRKQEVEHKLWPVPHVLKKMLQNEGVAFGDRHTRLDHGLGAPKLKRLCALYDLLRKEWFQKTLSDVHPAYRWDEPPARAEAPQTPVNVGWSFTREELPEHGLPRKSSHRRERLTIIAEKQPSMHYGLGPTIQEEESADSSSLDTSKVAVSTLVSTQAMTDATAAVRPQGPTTGAQALIHGSSPLQRANTASMLLADDNLQVQITSPGANEVVKGPGLRRHKHNGVLGLLVADERRRAKEQQARADEESQSKEVRIAEEQDSTSVRNGKKGNAVKKWLRSMFEDSEFARSMERMGRNAGGEF